MEVLFIVKKIFKKYLYLNESIIFDSWRKIDTSCASKQPLSKRNGTGFCSLRISETKLKQTVGRTN